MNFNTLDPNSIVWLGEGRNPFSFRVKKKMSRGGSFSEWEDGKGFDATWEGAFAGNVIDPPFWNRSNNGDWGVLCIIVKIDDIWFSWDVSDLSSNEATKTALQWKFVALNSLPEILDIQTGDWFGLFISAHPDGEPVQTDVRSDIFAVQYTGKYFVKKEKNLKGTPWYKKIQYPQFVMAPIAPILTPTKAREIYQEFIVETGFDGFHVPLQGQWSKGVDELLRLAKKHKFLMHFWLYGDVQSGTAPLDINDEQPRIWQEIVVEKLAPYSRWTMGAGFDLQEWASAGDIAGWLAFMKVGLSVQQRLGARITMEKGPYLGQLASVEYQVQNKNDFRLHLLELVDEETLRPIITADRFRVRPSSNKSKDWTPKQVVKGIKECRDVGVAAIWGYGDNVSDMGSYPWPNKKAIRKALGKINMPKPPPEAPSMPKITSLIYPLDEVKAGKLFWLRGTSENTDYVKISSDVHGPIDFSLPPNWGLSHRLDRSTTYTVVAVKGDLEVSESFTVYVAPRKLSWWERLLKWFSS